MAKKKKDSNRNLTEEELAEIENLTGRLGPQTDIPPEGQQEAGPESTSGADDDASEEPEEASSESSEELKKLREEARNNHELYVRALAEMDNLRKRHQREKEDISKFGNEMILREILPVIDNLERAVEHAGDQTGNEGLLEGVQMTLDQFKNVLQKFGVEPLSAQGEVFNPDHHQAMGQFETEEVPVNHVAQEMQKGYLLNNRLLRPSLVMIAKAPQSTTDDPAAAANDDEKTGSADK